MFDDLLVVLRPYMNCRNDCVVRIREHSIRLIEQFCTEMNEFQFQFNYLNTLWVRIIDGSLY